MLPMHDPPHPGEFISQLFLERGEDGASALADKLDLPQAFVVRLLNGQESVTPAVALRLANGVGRSPESWIAMQANFDCWVAAKR